MGDVWTNTQEISEQRMDRHLPAASSQRVFSCTPSSPSLTKTVFCSPLKLPSLSRLILQMSQGPILCAKASFGLRRSAWVPVNLQNARWCQAIGSKLAHTPLHLPPIVACPRTFAQIPSSSGARPPSGFPVSFFGVPVRSWWIPLARTSLHTKLPRYLLLCIYHFSTRL